MPDMPEKLPEIKHLYQNHQMDSLRWNFFVPRTDDIVVAPLTQEWTRVGRSLAERPLEVAATLRGAMRYVPAEKLFMKLEIFLAAGVLHAHRDRDLGGLQRARSEDGKLLEHDLVGEQAVDRTVCALDPREYDRSAGF